MQLESAERESLQDLIEEFKLGLMAQATDGSMDEDRYRTIRKHILGEHTLKQSAPRFVRVCLNSDDFRRYMQGKFRTYQERRAFLDEELAPLFETLENSESTIEEYFEFGERLGHGGFGTVYKARHRFLKMDFAVKVFEPSFDDGNPADLDRFFREARVLLSLNHPQIVRFYDAGLRGGKPFIRMEFVEGKDIDRFLKDHGRFPPEKARILVEKVLEGLVHAHEQVGVIHRDLKPRNIMVAPGEGVKIVDFGLGVFVEEELLSRITRTGETAVSGHFTAPELVENPRMVDPRTDLYSVGAVWFTCLTGRPPAGTGIANRLDQADLSLSTPYKHVILKSLADQPSRFREAREMLDHVRRLRG